MKYRTKSVAKAQKITAVKAKSYSVDFLDDEIDIQLSEDTDKNQDFFAIGQLKALEGCERITNNADIYRLQYGEEAAIQFLRGVSSVFRDGYLNSLGICSENLDSFSISCNTNYEKTTDDEGYSYIHKMN